MEDNSLNFLSQQESVMRGKLKIWKSNNAKLLDIITDMDLKFEDHVGHIWLEANEINYPKKMIECVPLTFPITYISSVSLKFRARYITGQWGESTVKNAISYLHILIYIYFLTFCCCCCCCCCFVFHQKNCVFIIFISVFDELLHLYNRILTNQISKLTQRTSGPSHCLHLSLRL